MQIFQLFLKVLHYFNILPSTRDVLNLGSSKLFSGLIFGDSEPLRNQRYCCVKIVKTRGYGLDNFNHAGQAANGRSQIIAPPQQLQP